MRLKAKMWIWYYVLRFRMVCYCALSPRAYSTVREVFMFSPQMQQAIMAVIYSLSLLFSLGILVAFCKILIRTGHNPAWVVLGLFPFLNVVCLCIFAFKSWPIDTRLQNNYPPVAPRPMVQNTR